MAKNNAEMPPKNCAPERLDNIYSQRDGTQQNFVNTKCNTRAQGRLDEGYETATSTAPVVEVYQNNATVGLSQELQYSLELQKLAVGIDCYNAGTGTVLWGGGRPRVESYP